MVSVLACSTIPPVHPQSPRPAPNTGAFQLARQQQGCKAGGNTSAYLYQPIPELHDQESGIPWSLSMSMVRKEDKKEYSHFEKRPDNGLGQNRACKLENKGQGVLSPGGGIREGGNSLPGIKDYLCYISEFT